MSRVVHIEPPSNLPRCGYCNRRLTAIERWCDCSTHRLARALQFVRDQFRRAAA